LTLASRSEFDRAIAGNIVGIRLSTSSWTRTISDWAEAAGPSARRHKNGANSAASRTTCRIESFSKRKHRWSSRS